MTAERQYASTPTMSRRERLRLVEEIDEVAVYRRQNWDHSIELNCSEREQAVRELWEKGLNDAQISDRLGYHPESVFRIRRRLNLPSNHVPGGAW